MKKLIVLAVAALFATSAFAGDLKWSGSAGMRYRQFSYDDGLNSLDSLGQSVSKQYFRAWNERFNVGATGGSGEVEYGFDVRSGTASVVSDYQTFGSSSGGAQDLGIAISQAWFKYSHDFGVVDMSLTFGRQKPVIAFDATTELLFANALRLDGFGWNFKAGSFGMNAAQYIFGAKSAGANGASSYTKTDSTDNDASKQSRMAVLFAWQPYMSWKFTDEISTKFNVGYYNWSNVENNNKNHGGYTYNPAQSGTVAQDAAANVAVNNPRQWDFYNTWTLPFNLGFSWEYIMNKKQYFDSAPTASKLAMDKSAFSAGLTYGKLAKAHDWMLGYNYISKGLAAVANTYASASFLSDNKGHLIVAKYNLADNLQLGFKGVWAEEKDPGKTSTGVLLTGAQASQKTKTKYMEVTAGVSF